MSETARALLRELERAETTHQRRLQIGHMLAEKGDPRPGVGVKQGVPDIVWLPVAPGGSVEVVRQ